MTNPNLDPRCDEVKTLDIALEWLRRYPGHYLFPLDGKSKPLTKYKTDATNDAAKLTKWHRHWTRKLARQPWFGIEPVRSGLVPVDVDTKAPKRGAETFELLELLHGWPETLEVQTPSGGRHLYYTGEHVFQLGRPKTTHPDIDFPQYVIMPGMVRDDGTAYTVISDVPIVAAPAWIAEEIAESKRRSGNVNSDDGADDAIEGIELDTDAAIEWAVHFLKHDAPPSIQGQHGDDTVIRVAGVLKDRAISVEMAIELMSEHYNVPLYTDDMGVQHGCDPLWEIGDGDDADRLDLKVRHAYSYLKQNKVGEGTAQAEFGSSNADEEYPETEDERAAREACDADRKAEREADSELKRRGFTLWDFVFHGPSNTCLLRATGETWQDGGVDRLLGRNAVRCIANRDTMAQVTWYPGEPQIIRDVLFAEAERTAKPGAKVFNLYRPPTITGGDPGKAGPWIDHVRKIYPDEADHIISWFAHRVQRPEIKINHCIVLGGDPHIGKDTLCAPVRHAVGPWNFIEASPPDIFDPFNAQFMQAVILRINEARDTGDARVNRYQFYERTKTMHAAPPETIKVNEKHLKRYTIPNLLGTIITTNNKLTGLYVPADDRRHYIAWSDLTKAHFEDGYFDRLWDWYKHHDGFKHVAAYLRTLDVSRFNPYAAPPKTPAFWDIVGSNRPVEESELAEVLNCCGFAGVLPPDAVTLERIISECAADDRAFGDLHMWLTDRKNRRVVPMRMDRAGYVSVPNPSSLEGRWTVKGRKVTAYARKELSRAEQFRAVQQMIEEQAAA